MSAQFSKSVSCPGLSFDHLEYLISKSEPHMPCLKLASVGRRRTTAPLLSVVCHGPTAIEAKRPPFTLLNFQCWLSVALNGFLRHA